MNINYNRPKARSIIDSSLNESQQQQNFDFNDVNPQQNSLELAKIITNENNFHKFSNGKHLIKIGVPIDTNGKLSLKWHLENSLDFDGFVQSINEFLQYELPEADVERLQEIYDAYVGV